MTIYCNASPMGTGTLSHVRGRLGRASSKTSTDWLPLALKRLQSMHRLSSGWDGEDAPAPGRQPLYDAGEFLEELQARGIGPATIGPAVVGGVGISIRRKDKLAYIEFLNNGRIYSVLTGTDIAPIVEPVYPYEFRLTIEKAEVFLNGRNVRSPAAEALKNRTARRLAYRSSL